MSLMAACRRLEVLAQILDYTTPNCRWAQMRAKVRVLNNGVKRSYTVAPNVSEGP